MPTTGTGIITVASTVAGKIGESVKETFAPTNPGDNEKICQEVKAYMGLPDDVIANFFILLRSAHQYPQ
jgi:hypothetical protein